MPTDTLDSHAGGRPARPAGATGALGRRIPWRLTAPILWLTLVLACAIGADWLPLPAPDEMDFLAAEQLPGAAHWLGTDLDGRDLLARLTHGARVSLTVCVAAPLIGLLFGTLLAMLSTGGPGWVRKSVLSVLDAMLAFPNLVFALGLTVVFGPSLRNVTLALGIMSIPAFARIARANILPLMTREFVLAARTAGASTAWIMLREVLPNISMPLLTYALTMGSVMIVAEGSLSFLGVGVPPPTPSWGSMIADGREALERVPHVSLIPAAVMFLTVLSLNLLGDALRRRAGAATGSVR
ncbi:ABC transporter permease [Cupriavidus gilardii]|uniref:ABC transporter permease n=1 Tax=Cupriavidus gilardii TaxID=82541 RepID=UPI001ABDCEA5|nr:ABC transporter permease [Cupriavidus gilardii]MBO4120168.1 ABC transporter permease [Cupriavidus gilardii]